MSHETIYRSLFIQARGVLKQELVKHLRSQRRIRRSRHASIHGYSQGRIVDAISIRERPAEAEDRVVPGHWEGDLLRGAGNSHVATLVERHSRFCLLVKVSGRSLLGSDPDVDRASQPSSWRIRMVAGVGFEPTTFGLCQLVVATPYTSLRSIGWSLEPHSAFAVVNLPSVQTVSVFVGAAAAKTLGMTEADLRVRGHREGPRQLVWVQNWVHLKA